MKTTSGCRGLAFSFDLLCGLGHGEMEAQAMEEQLLPLVGSEAA